MQNIYGLMALIWGYALGSVATAVLVCRAMRLPDPRTQGSNNPGATNVLRLGGKKAAIFTLLGDFLKGFIAVWVVKLLFPSAQLWWLLAGIGAFFGHLYPVFFGFKGGKGVATALGVLLAWHWGVAVIALAMWLTVFIMTRISSLSALLAAGIAPIAAFILSADKRLPIMVLALSAVLIFRHRENIQRLKRGEEKRFGK